jgi:hypothetical protein
LFLLIVFTEPQVQKHGEKGRPSSRWVFFRQRGGIPLPLVHAYFDTSRWGNPCDFDAARLGNSSTVFVHLDFNAETEGGGVGSPPPDVEIEVNENGGGVSLSRGVEIAVPRLSFTMFRRQEGGRTIHPFCSPPFQQ